MCNTYLQRGWWWRGRRSKKTSTSFCKYITKWKKSQRLSRFFFFFFGNVRGAFSVDCIGITIVYFSWKFSPVEIIFWWWIVCGCKVTHTSYIKINEGEYCDEKFNDFVSRIWIPSALTHKYTHRHTKEIALLPKKTFGILLQNSVKVLQKISRLWYNK